MNLYAQFMQDNPIPGDSVMGRYSCEPTSNIVNRDFPINSRIKDKQTGEVLIRGAQSGSKFSCLTTGNRPYVRVISANILVTFFELETPCL